MCVFGCVRGYFRKLLDRSVRMGVTLGGVSRGFEGVIERKLGGVFGVIEGLFRVIGTFFGVFGKGCVVPVRARKLL